MSKDIWVYAETNNGKLCDIVPELLTKGRQLKIHSDGDLVAVVLGAADEQAIGTLSEYGADKVIFGENKALEHYSARTYAQAMTALAKAVNTLGIGLSYAVFTGIGVVGTTFISIFVLKEGASLLKMLSLGVLIIGILGLKLCDKEGEAK